MSTNPVENLPPTQCSPSSKNKCSPVKLKYMVAVVFMCCSTRTKKKVCWIYFLLSQYFICNFKLCFVIVIACWTSKIKLNYFKNTISVSATSKTQKSKTCRFLCIKDKSKIWEKPYFQVISSLIGGMLSRKCTTKTE